jgi:hypothetical protein
VTPCVGMHGAGWASGRLQIDRFRALTALVGLGIEEDAGALVEVANPGALDGRHVHENILAAVVGLDETVALLRVVKFYGAALTHREIS